MVDIRELRTKARGQIHSAFAVRTGETRALPLYLEKRDAVPVAVNVRIHNKKATHGEVAGTSFKYAEQHEFVPQAIFLVSEVPEPKRNAIISVSPEEAYRIDNVEPIDGITVTVQIVPLHSEDREGLPVPGA